jgi:hypothetical protein
MLGTALIKRRCKTVWTYTWIRARKWTPMRQYAILAGIFRNITEARTWRHWWKKVRNEPNVPRILSQRCMEVAELRGWCCDSSQCLNLAGEVKAAGSSFCFTKISARVNHSWWFKMLSFVVDSDLVSLDGGRAPCLSLYNDSACIDWDEKAQWGRICFVIRNFFTWFHIFSLFTFCTEVPRPILAKEVRSLNIPKRGTTQKMKMAQVNFLCVNSHALESFNDSTKYT